MVGLAMPQPKSSKIELMKATVLRSAIDDRHERRVAMCWNRNRRQVVIALSRDTSAQRRRVRHPTGVSRQEHRRFADRR